MLTEKGGMTRKRKWPVVASRLRKGRCVVFLACSSLLALTGMNVALQTTYYWTCHDDDERARQQQAILPSAPVQSCQRPLWRAEFRSDAAKQKLLDSRCDFAQQILLEKDSVLYHRPLMFAKQTEPWFIYSVATDLEGAKLSANMCASLRVHGVTNCTMIGFADGATRWWQENESSLPTNAAYYNASKQYQWFYDWGEKFEAEVPKVRRQLRQVQAIALSRTFLYLDMLHRGVNTWMVDGDVVFPLDPKGLFLNAEMDLVYLLNIGTFRNGIGNYSYPFLNDGRDATINNGVVSARSSPSVLWFWRQALDRVLNHGRFDPQHPHNELLHELGLIIAKRSVAGYPDLDGNFGYYEGKVQLPKEAGKGLAGAVLEIMAVSVLSSYEDSEIRDEKGRLRDVSAALYKHVAVHAVGIASMAGKQKLKRNWLQSIGFWLIT